MGKLDGYIADSFPFRDQLRFLRAFFIFNVLMQTDKNGLYIDAYGAGEFRAINADSVKQTAGIIRSVEKSLPEMNVYYAFIPDKNIYSNISYPGFDPALTKQLLTGSPGMDAYTFIDLTESLSADSYYRTDLHWDQAELGGVLDSLGSVMGFTADLSLYSIENHDEFEGVYAGQLAMPVGTDRLRYYSCQNLTVMYLNEKTMEMEPGPVYNYKNLSGFDPYDFFLYGAQPVVILENPDADTDKELYLFRDSFSSSLAPLLASAYSKVTLIDLRFIDMRTLSRVVEFKPGSDVLFLYSSQILNNADKLLAR